MKSPAQIKDLANLDLIRSLAVLLVAFGHLWMYTGHGNLDGWMGLTGVCIFFVHTCLVLMWSMERDPHSGRFYIRRLFRLFPLWVIVLSLVVLLHLPVSPLSAPQFTYHAPSLREFLANAALLFNLFFGANVVGASWSLPIEAQMYLLLPLLFFFVRGSRALWVLIAIDLFVILSVWAALPQGAYVATLPICIPYFLPGVMAYALWKRVQPIFPTWMFGAYLAVGIAVHHRYGTLTRSWFFCLVLGLTLPFFKQITFRPLVRASHLVARYSYGIYLCHIPAIAIAYFYLRAHSRVLQFGVFLGVTAVASVILYHAVEAPMIRLGSRLARRIEDGPSPRVDEKLLSMEPAP